MEIPTIVWVAAWMQLLPLVVAARRPDEVRGPRLGVVAWLALLALMDLTTWSWSHVLKLGNNHFVSNAFLPWHSSAILWAVSEWQVTRVSRHAIRLCIPALLVLWIINIAFIERTGTFSVFGAPAYGMLILTAALIALVGRVVREDDPLLAQDWFWMLTGIAIFFATNATITLLQANAIANQDFALVDRSMRVKGAIDIMAMLCIAGGFLCPVRRASPGASSLRHRSA